MEGILTIHVAGVASCKNFFDASNVATSLQTLFPKKFAADFTSFSSHDEYGSWLKTMKQTMSGLEEHVPTDPVAWSRGNEYIGNHLTFFDWAKRKISESNRANDSVIHSPLVEPAPDADYDFDLVVVGGGSGGLACAKAASQLNATVAVVDFVVPSSHGTTWGLGGTCVNVGCIPKKLFVHAGLFREYVKDSVSFGWKTTEADELDWEKLVTSVSNYIRSINFSQRTQLREKKIKYINAYASFIDDHTLLCVDKKGKELKVSAKRTVVSVGGRPKQLSCPGGELAISTDDLFTLKKKPKKALVVGGSYIGLECSSFLNMLGCDVTLMVRSIFLRGFDQQMAELVGMNIDKSGVRVIRPCIPQSLEAMEDGKIKVTWDGDSEVFDIVLAAIGREPSIAGLNLETVGVEVSENFIVAEQGKTSNPFIFSIGDCVKGVPNLSPVAIRLGQNLAMHLYGNETKCVDLRYVPTAVFTPLEYCFIGMSEKDALEHVGENALDVYHSYFTPLNWIIPEHRESNQCYCKVLVDSRDDLVLGMHLICPYASEILQAYSVSMILGMRYSDLGQMIGVHPTMGEEVCLVKSIKVDGEKPATASC